MSRSDPAPAETVAESAAGNGVEAAAEAPADAAGAGALFDAVLHPHRSLSPAGFVILMSCISAVSFTTGIVFLLAGAWPIFGFFGLDVLLLYIAFRLNYRSGRLYETLHLTRERLTVQRVFPSGETRRWVFQPYWVRVHMDDPPRPESRLTLSSHGRSLAIGSFLTPEERLDVARALSAALAASRRPVHA
jgi:uncharacterized membrane protein